MAKNAEFKIVINGIQESINAVDSLNKQLDALEKRINDLSKRNINVSTSGGSNKAALDEEAKMLQQIEQLHQRVAASEKAEYQELLHAKEELKEYQTIAKSIAAQTNLDQGINNTNTMAGMKAQLHDIKTAMQTLDVESEKFKQLQQEANELNTKLKEIEQGYGQFGRNVGRYAEGVAEGISKYKVQIGDTIREFDSAKQAARELSNELLNLPKGAEGAQDLRKAIQSIKSDIKDLATSSNAMDNLLDTMQSFTALASVGEGISALFGIDDSEIEQTIQKLVALQNVMQGLEQLNQQMNTGEGLMGWLSKGNDVIDSLAAKITGASKAQETLNASTKAGKVASEGLAAAETAQAAATTTATVATKALSLALKTIGIGLVISLVATLVTYWKDIYQWFVDTIPALKNLSTWFDKIIAVASGVGNAIINYMVQPFATLVKTIQAVINGNFSDIPKIIGDGLKKTFNVAGNYQKGYHKEVERQQEKHNRKVKEAQRKANEEQLKDEEAKYGKSHQRTQEYYRKQMALVKEGSDEYRELQRKLWEDERIEREENERKKAGGSGSRTTRTTREMEDLAKKAEEDLTNITLEMMRDGLTKELAQLEYNNKKKIEEYRKNYKDQKEELVKLITAQSKLYEQQRQDILDKYGIETTKLIDENTIKEFENEIDNLNRIIEDKLKTRPAFIQPVSSSELRAVLKSYHLSIERASDIYDEFLQEMQKKTQVELENDGVKYLRYFGDFINKYGKDWEKGIFNEKLGNIFSGGEIDKEKLDEALKYAEDFWNRRYELAIRYGNVFRSLEEDETLVLHNSLMSRMKNEKQYFKEIENVYETYIQNRLKKEKEALATEQKMKNDELVVQANQLETEIENTRAKKMYSATIQDDEEIDKQLAALERRYQSVLNEQSLLAEEYANKIVELERTTTETLRELTEKNFRNFTSNIREYLTEMDKLEGKQPTYNALGFINYSATKKQFEEVRMTAQRALGYIDTLREDLRQKFTEGLITPEARSQVEKELNSLEISVSTRLDSVKRKSKELPIELYKQIDFWIQQVGQAATQIIQSIGDINQAAFEKQLEAIERQTDALEDQLDKQKELTQKYADDVNDIEDELENSRGDRRQFLIDQLNAQMEAQRESLAQEKRIEKEQERLDAKKKKLEDDNNKRKKSQAITTAIINAALAVSNAAVNTWPIPAVPMMALATAVGAAQIAAVKAAKYADGGVLQGKSHRQGGIKVLGGHAEVEGGEFVTNRRTTAQNSDLLYYINSKKKKLDLSDMIEFYSSKANKNISNTKTYFADGGQIPVLRNDIDLSDRLITTMEKYSEKPTVVQVVDIINKAESLRQVQTLAGLS